MPFGIGYPNKNGSFPVKKTAAQIQAAIKNLEAARRARGKGSSFTKSENFYHRYLVQRKKYGPSIAGTHLRASEHYSRMGLGQDLDAPAGSFSTYKAPVKKGRR
jgi:hypothetical protein